MDENENTGSQEPELAKVKVGDSEYEVPKSVAEAIEKSRELEVRLGETESRYNALLNQVEQYLKPRGQTPENGDTEKSKPKISGDLLWQDPDKFVQALTEQIMESVSGVKQELTQTYQKEKTIESFWSEFWAENKDLDRKQDFELVNAILNSRSGEWANLPIAEARKKLADETRKVIASYLQRAKRTDEDDKGLHVEGGGLGTAFRQGGQDREKVTTLSDILKKRREMRSRRQAS